MKILNKENLRYAFWMLIVIMVSVLLFGSCNKEELDIKQNFPFEVNVMPVPKDIKNGQTVEIRMTVQPSGSYIGTKYNLRYFQFDGKGTLRHYNETPYLPNDLYPLPQKEFRLYYTSASTVSQTFDVWVSDNFGNEKKLEFRFDNSD